MSLAVIRHYQYFCELGAEVLVRRNDALTLEEIAALAPEKIVISPGPCTPDEAGISLAVIRHYQYFCELGAE
ncbi:hypothetical protein CP989_25650, partial [Enterobacter hormaechei]|uniref:glutamine amidotransferase-related protein n=1 Tax=Enterobacter hormaechei TaxID=158836 RepID=UPI000BDD0131